jgi:PhnB protein
MQAAKSNPVTSRIRCCPYVNFQGRAREAMEFYHKVLGGNLDLQTVAEQGVAQPARPGDRISHARLEADGALIFATDGHPKYPAKVGENMAVALSGTNQRRLTKIFNDLAEGGKIKGPLTPQSWGAEVGWLTDKFGVDWMINIDRA